MRSRAVFVLVILALLSSSAFASSITWTIGFSDDNAGNFFSTAVLTPTTLVSGGGQSYQMTIDLPDYNQSFDFYSGTTPGFLSIAADISGLPASESLDVTYAFSGGFTPDAFASFSQTVGAGAPDNGLLTDSSPSYSRTVRIAGSDTVDMTGVFQLGSFDGTASLSQVQLTVTPVPEPSCLLLIGSGLPFIVFRRRR